MAKGDVYEKWLGPNVRTMRVIGLWNDSGCRAYYIVPTLVIGLSVAHLALAAKQILCDVSTMNHVVTVLCGVVLHANALVGNLLLMSNKPLIPGLCHDLEENFGHFERSLQSCEPDAVRRQVRKIPLGFFVFGFVCGAANAAVFLSYSLRSAMQIYIAVDQVLIYLINLTIDMLLFTLMLYAAQQLRLLMELIGEAARSGDDAPEKMAACVDMHCSLKRFTRKLERVIGTPMIFHFLMLTFMLCLHMFQLAAKFDSNDGLLEHVNSILMALVVLFTYCKLGEELKTWSERLRVAAYDTEWYESSISVKKTTLMILMNSEVPIVLKAGPFYTVTLESFLAVVKGAYTYFTIMRQMQL